jgi:DNA-directed RNA polymerase subunit K/omega
MSLRPIDVESLQKKTGNIYEAIAILGKRSRQIAAREKVEIDEKLKYFEGFEDEDEFSFNEEQERISKEYEHKAHPTQRSINEMSKDKVAFRYPEELG